MITRITQPEANELLSSNRGKGYAPIGQFWLRSDKRFVAIDNSTGEAWTEEFKTKKSCLKYLKGEPCMTKDESVTSEDNGITQTVAARQGVSLKSYVSVKPRVKLIPFRTFREVEQPASEFLLRVDSDGEIGLFEADGGAWQLEAKDNVASYFESALLPEIEAGRVVVIR